MLSVVTVCVLLVGLASAFGQAAAYPMTVTSTPDGISCAMIGACEGGDRFAVAELVDLGINNYRIWGSSAETEPTDDDGVFGSPSIAQIKANPSVIPWSVWDANFKNPSFRVHGVSLYDMLAALKNNGIAPVISLVNVNNGDLPVWMQQLNPPDSDADWNEWWEHVFAWVYYVNVLNNLEVHHWQVHNEPDNTGQGWGGTLQDYIVFTQKTYDAIKYVYDTYLPGRQFYLHAAQTVHANEWITESIKQNDGIIDVYDWHNYGNGGSTEAVTVHDWMNQYGTDAQHEEFYLSEWGTYRGGYDTVGNACKWTGFIMKHSLNDAGHIDGSAVFSMYEWGTMDGLVGDTGYKKQMFYAMRLVNRALQGGKQQYLINWTPTKFNTAIASVDAAARMMYITIRNSGAGCKGISINLDVSAHATSGTVTFRSYASGYPDVVIGTAVLANGQVTFDLPANSIVQVIVPLP